MSKNIKDYLHLYLGQAIIHSGTDSYVLKGEDIDYFRSHPKPGPVQLILRPLSDMTEEEEEEMIATQDDIKLEGFPQILLKTDSGETFRYMLSKGFDLFDLIESGLALDKTKQQ